jgi:hypothetical protein
MAYDALVERKIDLPRAKVFSALYDFGNIDKLLPEKIGSCGCVGEGVGAVRTIKLADGSGTVIERMEIAHDESIFGYTITFNDAMPMENYCAMVILSDADGGTNVSYGSNWDPKGLEEDEVRDLLEGIYGDILDSIAKGLP